MALVCADDAEVIPPSAEVATGFTPGRIARTDRTQGHNRGINPLATWKCGRRGGRPSQGRRMCGRRGGRPSPIKVGRPPQAETPRLGTVHQRFPLRTKISPLARRRIHMCRWLPSRLKTTTMDSSTGRHRKSMLFCIERRHAVLSLCDTTKLRVYSADKFYPPTSRISVDTANSAMDNGRHLSEGL